MTERNGKYDRWADEFILEVGAARSGTNFLGEVLSQHPDLAYWRRPKYVWRHGNAWKSDDCLTADDARPEVIRYIHRRFRQRLQQSGKRRLLACTQANSLALDFVNAVFPTCKIVHIIRDGREVALSQAKEWEIHNSLTRAKGSRPPFWKLLMRRFGEVPPTDLPAYFPEFVGTTWTMIAGSEHRYSMGPKIKEWKELKLQMGRLDFTALTWRECVTAARRVGAALPADRYYEVRFEDLVREPESAVAGLLAFLNLQPSPQIDTFVREQVDRSVAGKWLARMTDEDRDVMMPYIGELCRELGYV